MTDLRPLVVVEDSDEDFEALARVLRDSTLHDGIVRYATGEAALAGVGSEALPALVLLDINLPGLRGLDVLARWKADPVLRVVPVVVLSVSSREEDVNAAYAAGANAYLAKPIDFAEMRRTVLSLLEFWQNASLPQRRP